MRRPTALFPITLVRGATSFVPPRRPQKGEIGPQPREWTESVGPAPRLRYLPLTDFWLDHTSYPMVSIEKIMAARGLDAVRNPQARSWIAIARVLAKLRLPLNLWRTPLGPVFVTCVGTMESRTLPLACWTELIPYCFDCWAPEWDRWESLFRRHRIRLAFFTARRAAEHFARRRPQMKAIWVPEAVDPQQYDGSKPLAERRIDILELRRKHEQFHNSIRGGLEEAHKVHKFARPFEMIFPTAAELRQGFADTKISVCFPRSITHPEWSGNFENVETVTFRYFESFASRCVVVGHCPRELEDLFGYNPIVEIEPGRELEQILSVLEHIQDYELLVERNYKRLLETSTWELRVEVILSYAQTLIAKA
jgi:Glycosyl transferases group 1